MYKTHSILVALVMLSAIGFRNAGALHDSAETQEHHQHGGHLHRRAHSANAISNSSSSEVSPPAKNRAETLFMDLTLMLKDLASKYNITSQTNNSSEQASHHSSAGRKRAARPGCCG